MKMYRLLMAIAITTAIGFTGCSPKDADVQASVEAKLREKPDMAGASVTVTDGVATLSGDCKDAECKADCEKIAGEVKGVKSVVNRLSITPPPPPVMVTPDDPLTQSVNDATKDYPGVKAEINDGVVTLTGEIKRADLPKLMKALSSLKPKKIDNKLTVN